MTTAYTNLLGLALPVTGELQGTWGDVVNDSITSLLDTAIAGTTSLTTDADTTLSDTDGASNQSRQSIVLWNPASGTVTRNITAPARSKTYVVINATGGSQSIVFRGAGPTTGVTILAGEKAVVAWNGSDFVKVSTFGGSPSFTNVTVTGTTTLSGLTASTALALNASKEVVSVTNTGSGNNVLATSPTLVTPVLGAATATSINGLTVSSTTGTLTLANGSTLATSGANSLTLTTTGATNVTLPTSGTLATTAGTVASFSAGSTGFTPSTATTGAVTLAGTLATTNGGTGLTSFTSGGVVYASSTSALATGSALTFDGTNFAVSGVGVFGAGTTKLRTYSDNTYSGIFNGASLVAAESFYMGAGGQFFYAGGSEQMRLTSTGLGIGTSSPTDRLQVEASLDAASGAFVRNTNTGSSASGSVSVASGVGSIVIRAHSAAHSIWPNQTLINSGSGFSGGLNIFQNGASPIKFWTDSSERMRLDASGNLGIGTSSPTTKLTVSGGAKIGTGAATNNATLMVNQPNGSATGIQLFQDGQESWIMEVPASSTALRWTASGTEQMRLTSAGNLGIGTSSPSAKLVIQQANNTSDGVRQFANGNDSQLITRYLSSIDAWQVTASFAATGGYKPITWFTSDLERMRLDASGNLGIGTSSPVGKVDSVANATAAYVARASTTGANQTANALVAFNSDASLYALARYRAVQHIWDYNGTTEGMRLDSSGNLGIGTNSPTTKLHVNSGAIDEVARFEGTGEPFISLYDNGVRDFYLFDSTEIRLWGQANKAMVFATNNAERMRLDSAGNLSIRTTAVDFNGLTINGNIAIFNTFGLCGRDNAGVSESIVSITSANNVFVSAPTASGSLGLNVRNSTGFMQFTLGGTERMRLNASGNLLVGLATDTASARAVVGGTVISTTNTVSTFSGDYAGFDRTSSKNMRLFSGTSDATGSSIEFYTGVSGSVTERMRLDSSGNLGLGVTPSASWSAGFKALQISGQGAGLSASTTISTIYLSSNGIYNGTNWQYGNSAAAGQYQIDTNAHKWFTAPSGTAGNAISFTQAMTLDASGRLMVGTTSPAGILTVVQNANSATAFTIVNSDTGLSAASRIYFDTAGGGNYIETRRNGGGLWFNVNASDRLNIDNAGNILNVSAGGLGYGTGSGGAITQATSRTTGVTLNKTNGAITLVSAAGTATWQSFTVTNSTIAISDTVIVNQRSGTDLYMINVTAVAAGSFRISFATTGGTTTEQPVFNFAVIKAVTA